MLKLIEAVYRVFTATFGINASKQMMLEEVEVTHELFKKFICTFPPKSGDELNHTVAKFISWAIQNHGTELIQSRGLAIHEAFCVVIKNRPELARKVEEEIQLLIHTAHGREMIIIDDPMDGVKKFIEVVP